MLDSVCGAAVKARRRSRAPGPVGSGYRPVAGTSIMRTVPWAGTVAGPRTSLQYMLVPWLRVSMKCGVSAVPSTFVTRTVSPETTSADVRRTASTRSLSGGVPEAASAALSSAGASGPLDPLAAQVMYPTAERLLQHCDGVLRLPGESTGADQDVAIARERGIPVWHRVEDVPGYVGAAS